MIGRTVYVVEHIHKHGTDLSAYGTPEDAETARVIIAREYLTDDPDVDADAMTDDEAVAAHFGAESENECYVHDLTVEGTSWAREAGQS